MLVALSMAGTIAGELPVKAPSDFLKPSDTGKAPETSESAAVLFVSTNKNLAELDKQVTDLYLTLVNTGRLSVRKVAADGLSIDLILRQNNLLFGDKLSLEMDSLVCDLNEIPIVSPVPLCSRVKDSVPPSQLSAVTSHVSGYIPSPGKWRFPIDGTLLLPDARLERTQRWVLYDKLPKTLIKDVVVNELGGCVEFDDSCRSRIAKFNAKVPEDTLFDPEFGGRISLPVLGVRSRVDLSTAAEQKTQLESNPFGSGIALQPLDNRNASGSNEAYYKLRQFPASEAQKSSIANGVNGNLETTIRSLDKNLIGKLIASPFTTKKITPTEFQNAKLVDLIKFPWKTMGEYPNNMRQKLNVAVLDKWVDKEHCAFAVPANYDIVNIDAPPRAGAPKYPCDRQDDAANPDFDHGTHVAGIIGARDAVNGVLGLNPYAKVLVRQVDLNTEDPENVEKIKNTIDELAATDAPVAVNVSWGYFKDIKIIDHLGEAFESANSVLFVVAAGNEGERLSYICDVRPACFDLPNVISVAALDAKTPPKLLADGDNKKTNYGTKIHVGAIGESVFSTISYDRYGRLSGTSQAAPQVTAIASLLFSAKRFDPIEVKNRFIACSDFVDQFENQLLGGRINADCVLDYRNARLKRKSDLPDPPPMKGSLNAADSISFKHRVSGKPYVFKATEIRALHAAGDDKFVVFYNFDRSDSKTALLRQDNLVLDGVGQTVTFDRTDAGAGIQSVQVFVKDIGKYVSSIN